MPTQPSSDKTDTTPRRSGKPRENTQGDPQKRPEAAAKQDKERSDWEGMSPKPEQPSDDVAAPGQLPETD